MKAAIMLGISRAGALGIGLAALTPFAGSNSRMAYPAAGSILSRRYQDGEKLMYRMTGSNQEWRFQIDANGAVKKDASGRFFEEYQWTGLISDGAPYALPEASQKFRQKLSLDPDVPPAVPDLSHLDPKMIGPVTDFLTIYSDLWLANKTGILLKAGDHFYFKRGAPNSWADGNYVLLGQDSI